MIRNVIFREALIFLGGVMWGADLGSADPGSALPHRAPGSLTLAAVARGVVRGEGGRAGPPRLHSRPGVRRPRAASATRLLI